MHCTRFRSFWAIKNCLNFKIYGNGRCKYIHDNANIYFRNFFFVLKDEVFMQRKNVEGHTRITSALYLPICTENISSVGFTWIIILKILHNSCSEYKCIAPSLNTISKNILGVDRMKFPTVCNCLCWYYMHVAIMRGSKTTVDAISVHIL